jgi:uncharacterized protein
MRPAGSQASTQVSKECVDAVPLAARGATIEREFRLIDLPRLSDWAVNEQARAHLTARFHLVDARVGIAGRATANLRLVCQRCLAPVPILVDDEFHVVLVPSESEMDQLPEQQDAAIADATRLELDWLLEEQLLLAVPLVPLHATTAECAQGASNNADSSQTAKRGESQSPVALSETQRPFADLRDLLNQRAKDRSK